MAPLWGIFLIFLLPEITQAGRLQPPRNHPPSMLTKRMGPFANPQRQRQRIYNHPYMEMDRIYETHSSNRRTEEESDWPQRLPEAQLSNRKLLMPIISEGYASTNFQGGKHQTKVITEKPEISETSTSRKPSIEMKANVIEKAEVQEISSTTTKQPFTTTTTTPDLEANNLGSGTPLEYIPNIPDLVAQGATEDTSRIYDHSSEYLGFNENENPFIIRDDEYAQPPPPPPPPAPRPYPVRPRPPSSSNIKLVAGTAESVSPYDNSPLPVRDRDDSLSAPVITIENVPTNSDEYVRIVATPPEKAQINIIGGDRLPLSNVDAQGYFKPQPAPYSDKYLAGYEQLDFPDQGSLFPGHINPELIDPDDYHQDRPSFKASQIYGNSPKDYYPLGKPPPSPKVTPEIIAKGQDTKLPPRVVDKIQNRKQETKPKGGSFFDFLIPAFVRNKNSNKADPEGPQDRPKPKAKNTPGGPPSPKNGPSGPNKPPPVPDLSNLPHLKYPNRPLGTFPAPHEYGGRLNPILLRVGPNGNPLPGQNLPGQPAPGPPGPGQFPAPNAALKKIGLSKPDAEANLVEDEPTIENLKNKAPLVNLPPSPPLLRRPRPPNDAPLKMPSQPLAGISRIPPIRPQEPQNKRRPVNKPPMPLNLPGIPHNPQHRYPSAHGLQNKKLSLEEYKQKLQDPEFHQNLTKAHVYHAADLEQDVKDIDREDQVPSLTQALLSYLQDANPFNFRPKSTSKNVQQDSIQRISENNINEIEKVYVTESRIDEVVPIAVPTSKVSKINKPEVVYNPKTTTTTQSTTTTTTATTIQTTTTTTTHDPIADHVNLLLQQYFSTITPNQESDAVPMITYDDENNSVVMEYISPDGEKETSQMKNQEIEQAAVDLYNQDYQSPQTIVEPPSDTQVAYKPILQEVLDQFEGDQGAALYNKAFETPENPETPPDDTLIAYEAVPEEVGLEPRRPDLPSFFPESSNSEGLLLPQLSDSNGNFDNLLLPQPTAKFDRVFEPSSKTEEADWFVLNEHGTRQMDLHNFDQNNHNNFEQPQIDKRIDIVNDDSGIETDEDSTERETVGDFEPSIGPVQ